MKRIYIELDRFQEGKYTVYTSTNGGQMKNGIFTGTVDECITIAAAFIAIGYHSMLVHE